MTKRLVDTAVLWWVERASRLPGQLLCRRKRRSFASLKRLLKDKKADPKLVNSLEKFTTALRKQLVVKVQQGCCFISLFTTPHVGLLEEVCRESGLSHTALPGDTTMWLDLVEYSITCRTDGKQVKPVYVRNLPRHLVA